MRCIYGVEADVRGSQARVALAGPAAQGQNKRASSRRPCVVGTQAHERARRTSRRPVAPRWHGATRRPTCEYFMARTQVIVPQCLRKRAQTTPARQFQKIGPAHQCCRVCACVGWGSQLALPLPQARGCANVQIRRHARTRGALLIARRWRPVCNSTLWSSEIHQ